jgi:hypothetical protein
VPRGDDRDVYMVEDDLGRLGHIWPEADSETTDFETIVTDLLTGQYSHALRVLPSMSRKGGRAMHRTMWPMSCGTAVTFSCAIFRSFCRTSLIATKAAIATCNCRCRCAWSDYGVPAKRPAAIGVKAAMPFALRAQMPTFGPFSRISRLCGVRPSWKPSKHIW